jgi:hypothetical protein
MERSGWWRRVCADCRRLAEAFLRHRGAHMGVLMDTFLATGAPRQKLEAFLDADPTGAGSVRDQIAADMTNQLMGALGQRTQQTVGDVKRLRKRGNWMGLGQRPRE